MTEVASKQATGITRRDRLFIGGEWVEPAGSGTLDVVSSATEAVIATIPEGTPEDAGRAVAAARAAFDGWSQTLVEERAATLERVADGLKARRQELQEVIADEVGMPVSLSPAYQLGSPPYVFRFYADMARSFDFETEVRNSVIVREPVGVVVAITPWNYPLHQIALKVAPAMAAGNTVVLKPSEVAPLNAFILAEVMEAAAVPAGVFNLVTGTGPVVGEALVSNPDVDMVSFTGSTNAGKRVSALASATVKKVALELGGKSANIILDDADIETAVRRGVEQVMINSGQSCNAWSRMLVPRGRQDEVARIAAEAAENTPVGDPHDPGSFVGPLISATQLERVRGYIRKGESEGARLVTGGAEQPDGLEHGYYVRPTIFADVRPDMAIAQEEIFGPVVSIIPYDTEEEAIEIANDSIYGLAGAVWSGDVERAKRVARRIRTGQVDINGGAFNMMAPFGGYKQSGNGRELGTFGLEEFLEVKSLQL